MTQSNNGACHRICLTPMRNEAWIAKQFAAAAASWADNVIVADQGSTDGTVEQLRATPGVDLVINDNPTFDELHRQKLLINRARETAGKRILIALDADEAISANFVSSEEWKKLSDAEPGTVVRFRWVNILPGFEQAWIPDQRKRCGFIDDGREHTGRRIHNQRVPGGPEAPVIDLNDVVLLHFQYVAWERMRRKHRWYQAWEHAENRKEGPLEIFRHYNHMHGSWEKHEIYPIKPEWLEGYDRAGVNFRALTCEPITWWDKEVARMLAEHGPKHFRKLAIWDQDWNALADQIQLKHPDLGDPRSWTEKTAHRLLAATQEHRENVGVRALERWLRMCGW
jgi:hypothetical protein